MRVIGSYEMYSNLIENTFQYEDLSVLQNSLNTLFNRDKSELIGFQTVNRQINEILSFDPLDIVMGNITELDFDLNKSTLTYLVNDWDNLVANSITINKLLAICFQYKDKIQYETLKFGHKVQQSMTIDEIPDFKNQFLQRLRADLTSYGVDFSGIYLKNKDVVSNEYSNEFQSQLEAVEQKQREIQLLLEEEKQKQAKLIQQLEAEQYNRMKLAEEIANLQSTTDNAPNGMSNIQIPITPTPPEPEVIKTQDLGQHIHNELNPNKNTLSLECPKCGKKYQAHYKMCLKDGSQLIPITTNFSV